MLITMHWSVLLPTFRAEIPFFLYNEIKYATLKLLPLPECLAWWCSCLAAQLLVMNGCSVNLCGQWGMPAVHTAVMQQNVKLLALLLASGANVRSRDHQGCTPLHLAARIHRNHSLGRWDRVMFSLRADPQGNLFSMKMKCLYSIVIWCHLGPWARGVWHLFLHFYHSHASFTRECQFAIQASFGRQESNQVTGGAGRTGTVRRLLFSQSALAFLPINSNVAD